MRESGGGGGSGEGARAREIERQKCCCGAFGACFFRWGTGKISSTFRSYERGWPAGAPRPRPKRLGTKWHIFRRMIHILHAIRDTDSEHVSGLSKPRLTDFWVHGVRLV